MDKAEKILITSLCSIFLLLALVYLLPFPILAESGLTKLAYLLSSFIPFLGSLYAFMLYGFSQVRGKVFLFITLAFLSLFLGELIWTIYLFLGMDPFPTVADYFYILFYPLLFIGLFKEIQMTHLNWEKINLSTKVFGGLFMFFLVALVGYFSIYFAYNPESDLLSNGISIAYGVGDLILIFLSFFILKMAHEFKGGRLFSSWLAFSAGLFLTLMADLIFSIYNDAYVFGNLFFLRLMDLLWMASFMFFAYCLFSLGNMVRLAQKKALPLA